jgi:hypothetical protein
MGAEMKTLGMTGWTMYPPAVNSDFTNHVISLQGNINFPTPADENKNEEQIKHMLAGLQSKKVSFVLVVIPRRNQNIYAMVKRMGDAMVGLPTFCLVAKGNAINTHPQYLANVAMKINLKLRGAN